MENLNEKKLSEQEEVLKEAKTAFMLTVTMLGAAYLLMWFVAVCADRL